MKIHKGYNIDNVDNDAKREIIIGRRLRLRMRQALTWAKGWLAGGTKGSMIKRSRKVEE